MNGAPGRSGAGAPRGGAAHASAVLKRRSRWVACGGRACRRQLPRCSLGSLLGLLRHGLQRTFLYYHHQSTRATMDSAPPPSSPSWRGCIAKRVHKCVFCPRTFCSAVSRQRHMQAMHANDNPWLAQAPAQEHLTPAAATDTAAASSVAVLAADDGGAIDADAAPPTPAGPTIEGDATRSAAASQVALAAAASVGYGLAVTAAASEFVNTTAVDVLTRERNDGVARGTLAGPRPLAGAVRHVFATSVAARIRGYYDALPEASLSTPAVSPLCSRSPVRFRTPVMRSVLKFALGTGGCGLSRKDQSALGSLLLKVENGVGRDDGGEFAATFDSGAAFVAGVRTEQNRILSRLNWLKVPIELGGDTYTFYYRDLLDVAVDAVQSAAKVDLNGGSLSPAADGSPRRSSTLNADMFVKEVNTVRALHGERARPLFASLHADAAVVSWSGAAYVYPIRVHFPSVCVGSGEATSRWVTVGYIPHIPKPVNRTDKARLAVSDCRNDLLQRCLALVIRRFARASETGYPVVIPGIGTVLLVARIGGVVVDFIEERSLYALMGTRSNLICTLCCARQAVCCSPDQPDAHPRNVIETLEAQLGAAERRTVDPRASLRAPLGKAHSALAFAPVLGSMHGLSTGNMNYFRVISFDLLHVWKLGVLRTLAQRLPGFLRAVCTAKDGAVMGAVQQTLDALNLRGFELGRRCRVTPTAPGCFVPPKDKQSTMTGRTWRHFSVFWPHMVAGLIGPADPERLVSVQPANSSLGSEDADGSTAAETDCSIEVDDDEDAHQPIPAGIEIGEGTAYHRLFGQMAVQDAVQDMFCQAAHLGGLFFGDNKADTVHTTGTEVAAMADAALKLGRCAQVLLGPVHTSKLHRLMRHLRAELEGRGNLWEGDTSCNEALHKVCKKMYQRSNKRGPTLAMQMMRGEQALTEVLRGLSDGDSGEDDESEDEERAEERNAISMARADDVHSVPDSVLRMSTRGVRMAVGELSAHPGFEGLPVLLEMDPAEAVSAAKTAKFYAKFEWGASTRVQFLRATPSFNLKPWYDHVRYEGDDGQVRWGQARLVLRGVGPFRRNCVVVRRMRVVQPEPGCVLTARGCKRLGWQFDTPESLWPAIEAVNVGRLLRLENIVPDWQDLARRRGLEAMPSKLPLEEYRRARFFVNVFYPWTSRPAVGDL